MVDLEGKEKGGKAKGGCQSFCSEKTRPMSSPRNEPRGDGVMLERPPCTLSGSGHSISGSQHERTSEAIIGLR